MRYLIPLLFAFAWLPTADAQTAKPSGSLEGRVGRLEGIVEQIDKRLTNIEQDQRDMLKRMEAMSNEINVMRGEMNIMSGEINTIKRDMVTMRSELSSEISTTFRWLVGIMVTLFLGNVGVNWYWNRKNSPTEAPGPVPRREESRPAARPSLVDQP